MIGGAGDDSYFVDNVDDVVIEYAGEGNDTVYASIDYALPANVENLVLTGTTPLVGDGNAADNVLWANAGGSTLRGHGGHDTFYGGSGNDVLISGSGSGSAAQPGLHAEYFNNADGSGTPALVRNENIDFDWGTGSPGPGVNSDNFSVHWSGQLATPAAGTYELQWFADDTFQVTIDGQQVINQTGYTGQFASTSIGLAGGSHTVTAQMSEGNGGAGARLRWRTPGSSDFIAVPLGSLSSAPAPAPAPTPAPTPAPAPAPTPAPPAASTPGLQGEYFNTPDWSGTPALVRHENIDFSWGDSPGAGVVGDFFSARWSGELATPSAGTYELQWFADDAFQVTIDGQQVISQPGYTGQFATTSITLGSGSHAIVAQMSEIVGPAAAQLRWKPPGSTEFVAIPLGSLSDGTGNGTGTYAGTYADPVNGPASPDLDGDIFDGGAGNDTLLGSGGDDTYRWGLGQGSDTITDAGGAMDHVDFFAGITRDQLHFARNADDLEVNVMGQTDKLIVTGWYGSMSSTRQIEEFRFSDGDRLLASQVQGLVSAMAQFAASGAVSTDASLAASVPAWRSQEIVAGQIWGV